MSETMKQAALQYAKAGVPVFPLIGKLPLTERGFHDATTDVEQVESWWDQFPDANIGMPTGSASGIVVVDLDGPDALANLEAAELELPGTRRVETREDRAHLYYFQPEDWTTKNSAGVTGWLGVEQVDIRGDGGYVVVPPSIHPDTKDVYTTADATQPMAMAPEWLRYDPEAKRPASSKVKRSILDRGRNATVRAELPACDRPVGTRYGLVALARELGHVAQAKPGERQTTLNTASFIVGKMVGGGHLDLDYAALALLDHAPVSHGPDAFTEFEAEETITRGVEQGMDQPEPSEASEWITVGEYEEGARAERHNDGIRIYTLQELRELPGTDWLIERVLPADGLVTIYGPSGVGKSFAAIGMALAMGVGHDRWGNHAIAAPTTTVYAAAEGGRGIAKRADAWLDYHDVGDCPRFKVVTQPVNLLDRRAVSVLLREVERMPDAPGMIVIDTLARSMPGGEENSAQSMGEVLWACDLLRVETGATIVLVHHTGHGRDSKHRERGSSALPAAMDARWLVEPHRLVPKKVKEEEPPAPIGFTLKRHDRSLVFLPSSASDSPHLEVEQALEQLGGRMVSFAVLQYALSDGQVTSAGWVRSAVGNAVNSPTSPVQYDEQTQSFYLADGFGRDPFEGDAE